MYREHRTNMEMISKLLYHDSPADTRLYLGIQDDEVYDDDVPMKYTIGGGKEGRAMKEQWENDPIIQVISRKSEDQGIIHAYQDGRMSSDIRDAMEKAFRDYIRSEEWKAVTKEVIKRYKGVCQGCGTTEKNGKVVWYAHHKDYLHFGKANDEEIADCTLYCKRCHNKRHSSSDMKGKVPFWAQRKYKREYM
jgi:5-methylcytosine-specific restriction endonuclease McrA